MKNTIFIIFSSILLFSCTNKEQTDNSQFWEVYEWFYKEKSLDKSLVKGSHSIEDKSIRVHKYLVDGFREEFKIDSNWDFDYQEFEYKSSSYGKSIIEIATYFTNNKERLLVLEVYYNSVNVFEPMILEQNVFHVDKGKVDFKTLWNGKISLH